MAKRLEEQFIIKVHPGLLTVMCEFQITVCVCTCQLVTIYRATGTLYTSSKDMWRVHITYIL